ncbi:hypothetical protein [Nocardioides sp.]|uniref:hypothetical protein n=1 Tax=Nocardioides sp. TaxID=35761 RepID=UPI0019B89D61|nr:hypothetical protein [Nocardioides sp.]MBC7276220.1 hypothetical protein [Nocardioides sp.]
MTESDDLVILPLGRAPRRRFATATFSLVAVLSACGNTTDDDPDPVSYARPAAVAGSELQFQLPSGGFTLVVGKPVTTIPADETADGEPLEAGTGERFVPVADVRADGNNIDSMIGPTFSDYPDATVDLLVDDRRYSISDDTSILESYIRVKADAESKLGAAATFDGVRQVMWTDGERDTGEAEALYGYPKMAEIVPCDDGWEAAPGSPKVTFETMYFNASGCNYKAVEYPYVVDLGWSFKKRNGAMWAWVESSMRLTKASVQVGQRMRECDAIGTGKAFVTVDGDPAVKPITKNTTVTGGPAGLQQNVFLVDPSANHALRIETSHPCVVGRETHRIDLVWEKHVPFTTSSTAD